MYEIIENYRNIEIGCADIVLYTNLWLVDCVP